MKKFYYIVGAVVTAAAVFAFVAVMLKKLKISLSIEGIDDESLEEPENDDIELTIEKDEKEKKDKNYFEDEEFIKNELDGMLEEEADEPEVKVEIKDEPDIEVEFTEVPEDKSKKTDKKQDKE